MLPEPSFLMAIRQPIFLYGADGTIAAANDLAETFAGRPVVGMRAGDLIDLFSIAHPDGTPLAPADLPAVRALGGEEAIDLPLTIRAADGRRVSVLVTASPLREDGQVVGAVSLWQNVTRLIEAEEDQRRLRAEAEALTEELAATTEEITGQNEELHALDEELRSQAEELMHLSRDLDRQRRLLDSILGTLPHHVNLWDAEGRYVWMNQRVAEALGRPRESLFGKDWREIGLDPTVIEPFMDEVREVIATGKTISREVAYPYPDGIEWRAYTIVPFSETTALAVSWDITDRKRMEEALADRERNARERLAEIETLYATAPIGLSVLDRDLRYVRINRRLAEINGVPIEAHLGRTVREVVPDLADQAEVTARRILATGEAVHDIEVGGTTVAEPGALRYWSEQWAPIRDDEGTIVGIAVAVDEITDRMRVEEARRRGEARQALVAEVASRLLSIEEPQAIVDDLCRRALAVLDCDVFFNYLADGPSDRLRLNSCGGIPAEEAERIRWLEYGAAVCGCVARDGSRIVAEAIPDHPDPRTDLVAGYGVRAYACHPLLVKGKAIGTLSFGTCSRDRFTDDELATMRTIADLIAVAMQRLADRDALRESEERFRLAQTSADLGVWDWDPATGRHSCSHELLRLYGVPGEMLLDHEMWRKRVHPDDLERMEAERDWALSRREPFELEFRVLQPSGETRWLASKGSGIYDEGGDLVRVLGVNIDITRRKQVERALAESEAAARSFMENLPDACAICEPARVEGEPVDIRLVEVNAALVREMDRPEDEIVNLTVSELLPELASPWSGRLLEIGRTGVPVEFEEEFPTLGRWFQITAFPVRGERIAILFRNITRRKEAEESLRQSREWFRIMGETLPYGVWMCNAHGGAEYVSQSFLDLLEMTAEEMREFGWTHRLPPEDVEPMMKRWLHSIRTGEDWDDEHRVLGPDGVYHTVLTRGRPVRNESGTVVAWVGINLDIDDRKRAEESLKDYAEQLRTSNDELQRFAYVASHDLQEPLRSIVSFSQLLDRRYRNRLDADADEYLGFIVEGGLRMQALIQDLLAFSRIGTTSSVSARVDTGGVLAGVELGLAVLIAEAGAIVTHDSMPVVQADRSQIEQVFSNLLGNALKYRRPEVPPRIHIGARRLDQDWWEFAVKDNGIGIAPEYFNRIFVIFQRLHTKDKYTGTGIGLAIVRKIIERHGGTIRVESTPGEGSTFIFTLPAP